MLHSWREDLLKQLFIPRSEYPDNEYPNMWRIGKSCLEGQRQWSIKHNDDSVCVSVAHIIKTVIARLLEDTANGASYFFRWYRRDPELPYFTRRAVMIEKVDDMRWKFISEGGKVD